MSYNSISQTICKRCGRKLRNEANIKLGMGAVCFRKWKKENIHKQLFKMEDYKNE